MVGRKRLENVLRALKKHNYSIYDAAEDAGYSQTAISHAKRRGYMSQKLYDRVVEWGQKRWPKEEKPKHERLTCLYGGTDEFNLALEECEAIKSLVENLESAHKNVEHVFVREPDKARYTHIMNELEKAAEELRTRLEKYTLTIKGA